MNLDIYFICLLVAINLVLIGIMSWQYRQLQRASEAVETLVAMVGEASQVVNHNADTQRQALDSIREHEAKLNFLLPIIDAHAQVLRVYQPVMVKLDAPATAGIVHTEFFGEENS